MITLYFTATGMAVLLFQIGVMESLALLAEIHNGLPTHPTHIYPDYVPPSESPTEDPNHRPT